LGPLFSGTAVSVAISSIPGIRVIFDSGEAGEITALRLIQPGGEETVMMRK
jgi:hypothetical protein